MKMKGDSWAVLQQKQWNVTTSRSLNVMYVRETKQDSGLQFCGLFRFFWIYRESFWLLQNLSQINQTDMEVQYAIQTKEVNRSTASYELIWMERVISALWQNSFSSESMKHDWFCQSATWILLVLTIMLYLPSVKSPRSARSVISMYYTWVWIKSFTLHPSTHYSNKHKAYFPKKLSFYSGEGVQFLYPENYGSII